jgi:hypothetical protein
MHVLGLRDSRAATVQAKCHGGHTQEEADSGKQIEGVIAFANEYPNSRRKRKNSTDAATYEGEPRNFRRG